MTRFLRWPIIVFYLLFHFDAWAKVFIDYRHIWPEAPSERVLNSFPTGHFYTFISLMEAQHFSKFGGQQRRISMEDFFCISIPNQRL